MSTQNHPSSSTLGQTTTRRSFLKTIAAGAAASALLATGRIVDAGRALPNREAGTAPVIGGASSFRSTTPQRRYEPRTPE